jgi:hypothetical protein
MPCHHPGRRFLACSAEVFLFPGVRVSSPLSTGVLVHIWYVATLFQRAHAA